MLKTNGGPIEAAAQSASKGGNFKSNVAPAAPAPHASKMGSALKLTVNDLKVLDAIVVHCDQNVVWMHLFSNSDQ